MALCSEVGQAISLGGDAARFKFTKKKEQSPKWIVAVSDRSENIRNRFLTIFYKETILRFFFSTFFFQSKKINCKTPKYFSRKGKNNFIKEKYFFLKDF